MKCRRFDGFWSEELVDGQQTVPYQPGARFCRINCLVVFPTHFIPNNSHLILLKISFLFINRNKNKWDTNRRSGQYLTHAHSHITCHCTLMADSIRVAQPIRLQYLYEYTSRILLILSILAFRTLLLPGAAPARQNYIKYKLSKIMLLG